MSRLFDDTTPEAEEEMVRLLRDMPATRKLELVCQLSANVRQLAVAGLRERHPEATDEEIRRRLADLLLGKELAAEVYGPLPPGSEPTYIGEDDRLRGYEIAVEPTVEDLLALAEVDVSSSD